MTPAGILRTAAVALTILASSVTASDSTHLRSEVDQSPRNLEAMEYMAAMTGTKPGCYPENNWAYIANDVANNAGQAIDCCLQCLNTQYCHGFTWTNYNGGTCWLKAGRGQMVWSPGSVSSIVINPGQPVCALEQGIDYVDNDIGNAPAASADKCCAACEGFKGCRAFSWSNHNGGTCWFKSQVVRKVVSAGVVSAEAFGRPETLPNCGLEKDVDLVGSDIRNVPAAMAEDCCSKCWDTMGCRAFTWTNLNGGTCWLKNLRGTAVAKAGAYSATVFANPAAPSCALESGVDYVGNDIGNAPGKNAYDCCSACLLKDGCKAFSWSNYLDGTCWFKSAKGSTAAKAGVLSSIVVV